ncbi:hepatocyte growth factor receptor-like isoform X1 [Glandiceps talaboti]
MCWMEFGFIMPGQPAMTASLTSLVTILLGYSIILSNAQSYTYVPDYGVDNFTTPEGWEFQHLAVHKENGQVYIGATNYIYHLSADLELKLEHVAGPAIDNPRCLPEGDCDYYKGQIHNVNKILLIHYEMNRLITCGDAYQGTCQLHFLHKISPAEGRIYDESNIENDFVATSGSTVAFMAPAPPDNQLAMYVGATYNANRPSNLAIQHAVSSKRIAFTFGQYGFLLAYEVEDPSRHTFIDVRNNYKESYKIKYIYGFTSGDFSYFVTVQRKSVQEESYHSRIIRICNQDKGYFSYTELPLRCTDRDSIYDYNLAQAAYVSKVGEDLAESLRVGANDDVLFVVFSQSDGNTNKPSNNSALCMFTLKKITKKFTSGIQDCFYGNGFQGLRFFSNNWSCSIVNPRTIEDDFCGTGELHPIEVHVALASKDYLLYAGNGSVFTSVLVTVYESHTFALIGTEDGILMKVIVDAEGERSPDALRKPYQNVTLSEGPIKQDMALDITKEYVYVMTPHKVFKLPVHACSLYTDCSVCVTTPDPVGCGWCDGQGYCSTREECSGIGVLWGRGACPPAVYMVSPLEGPKDGGTLVSIMGDNLGIGIGPNTHKITVSGEICVPVPEKSNLHELVCNTTESEDVGRGPVVLVLSNVQDDDISYIISGTASSSHSFNYVDPVIDNFSPKYGAQSGGTKVTINGKYLDVGTGRFVLVAGQPCVISRYTFSQILCTTTPSETMSFGPAEVHIDNAIRKSVDNFNYTTDPIIYDVSPRRTFLSGGIPMTVTGHNLHVISEITMVATVMTSGGPEVIEESCRAAKDGLTMTCPAPNVAQTGVVASKDEPKDVTISFQLDNTLVPASDDETDTEWHKLTYFPDPVYFKFPEEDNFRKMLDDRFAVYIDGIHLNLSNTREDVTVVMGNSRCNITDLQYDVCICDPPKRQNGTKINEPRRKVEVYVGNLEFEIGYIQYVDYPSKGFKWQYIVTVILLGIALIIMIVVYWRYRRRKNLRKKLLMRDETDYTTVVYRPNVNGDECSPYRPEMNNSRNTYLSGPRGLGLAGSFDDDTPLLHQLDKDLALNISDVLIERRNLELEKVVGRGHFGLVYHGLLKTDDGGEVECAIKTLLEDSTTDDVLSFLREGVMMKDFRHKNVLQLCGICIHKKEPPLVILPFMRNGDLLSFIRNPEKDPTVRDLITFCLQISEGMEYLANLKFVHRDLAARNCMLADDLTVKVADFGLSRDIYERDYYSAKDRHTKLPVRWMALESLERNIYNNKTDVWSFGVVLWELMTRGVTPYPSVDNWDISKYLRKGKRLPQPQYCSDELYDLMVNCWSVMPDDRPDFTELVYLLKKILTSATNSRFLDVEALYMNMPRNESYTKATRGTPSTISPTTPSSPSSVGPTMVANSINEVP